MEKIHPSQFLHQCGSLKIEEACCLSLVSTGSLERLADQVLLDIAHYLVQVNPLFWQFHQSIKRVVSS